MRKLLPYIILSLIAVAWVIPAQLGIVWLIVTVCVLTLLLLFLYFIDWTREQLKILNTNINEILRTNDLGELCNKAVIDFVEVFGADYAVISKVDFLKRRIKSEEWHDLEKRGNTAKSLGGASPKEWIHKSDYPLDPNNPKSKDILVEVLKLKDQVKVIDNRVQFGKIPDNYFNEEIINVHQKYARVYFPIIFRRTTTKDDISLGVVELGFKNKLSINLSITRIVRYITLFANFALLLRILSFFTKDISKVLDIELYLSVFAEQYHKLLLQALEKEGINYLFNKNEQALEDISEPRQYLEKALERIKEFVGGNYGMIVFRNTFNYDTKSTRAIPFGKSTILSGINASNIIEPFISGDYDKSIIKHILLTNDPYFSANVNSPTEEHYIRALNKSDIVSEIGIPLRQNDKPTGALFLDAPQPNYYNVIHAQVLERMTRKLMPEYLRKKKYYVYQQLSEPSNVWESTETLYKSISDLLREYFEADYIAVWTRKSLTEKTFELCQAATSDQVLTLYEKANLTETEIKDVRHQKDPLIRVISCKSENSSRFTKVCRANGFQSYLLISVVVQEKYEVFFNVLSKTKLADDFLKKDLDFLLQISNKTSISLQGLKLVKSFSAVAKALSTPWSKPVTQGYALSQMVENALWVTNADIVSFFPYYGQDILVEDATQSGGFSIGADKGEPEGGVAKLANLIIKNGTQWFSNQKEYEGFLDNLKIKVPPPTEQKGFRFRNNIKSTAGVCIEYDGFKKGVIFFNYRNEISFDDQQNLKSSILAFSTFLGLHLVNRGTLLEIQAALESMKTEAKRLSSQRDAVVSELLRKQNEIKEIEEQFADLLPRATRTSFYQILEGINHNIKHSLFEIYNSLKNIDSARLTSGEKELVKRNITTVNKTIGNVETMLELFDFNGQEKEKLDVNQIIIEVIKFVQINEYKFINFEINLGLKKPLLANKAEITMIFYNIITNSVQTLLDKYDNSKKHFQGTIYLETGQKANNYIFVFKDNGMGIDSENIGRIFDRGFTTKKDKPNTQKGTGIGLYFVKEILENEYQGRMYANSRIGHGTEFIIEIPEHINFNINR